MSDTIVMLSTEDNPFDPFEDYESWYAYDVQQGYHCCALLARIGMTSNELSEEVNNHLIDTSINEIVDLFGFPYIKVMKNI